MRIYGPSSDTPFCGKNISDSLWGKWHWLHRQHWRHKTGAKADWHLLLHWPQGLMRQKLYFWLWRRTFSFSLDLNLRGCYHLAIPVKQGTQPMLEGRAERWRETTTCQWGHNPQTSVHLKLTLHLPPPSHESKIPFLPQPLWVVSWNSQSKEP